ncbi:MAG: hypothetical protein JWO11_3823 [Nocardioides sp.]|nr:hypothetical protein [Nocardioides sp.]
MTTIHHADPSETMESMPAQISMPYTLTPGQATGIFLAELRNRRLIGSRHGDGTILVPAQDFCGSTGEPVTDFVEVAAAGELQAFTTTARGTIGMVLIDGTSTPFVHQILQADPAALEIGTRVEAVWAVEATGTFLDLAGFRPAGNPNTFEPRESPGDLAEPLQQVDYRMTLDYQHAYGQYYGTLFDGVKNSRRIRGVRCSECRKVLLPPRSHCDVCFARTHEWIDVKPTGTIQACSVVHIEFIGQRLTPPYIYAEIVLDGSSTRLIHMVGGDAANADKHAVEPGNRVRAVWSERRTGSLADIEHFELLPADEDPS